MKFQGQSITNPVLVTSDGDKSSFSSVYQITDERAEEIKETIISHWLACREEEGTNVHTFLTTLPIEAAVLGELAVAGIFIGQLITHAERSALTPFQRFADALRGC